MTTELTITEENNALADQAEFRELVAPGGCERCNVHNGYQAPADGSRRWHWCWPSDPSSEPRIPETRFDVICACCDTRFPTNPAWGWITAPTWYGPHTWTATCPNCGEWYKAELTFCDVSDVQMHAERKAKAQSELPYEEAYARALESGLAEANFANHS